PSSPKSEWPVGHERAMASARTAAVRRCALSEAAAARRKLLMFGPLAKRTMAFGTMSARQVMAGGMGFRPVREATPARAYGLETRTTTPKDSARLPTRSSVLRTPSPPIPVDPISSPPAEGSGGFSALLSEPAGTVPLHGCQGNTRLRNHGSGGR